MSSDVATKTSFTNNGEEEEDEQIDVNIGCCC